MIDVPVEVKDALREGTYKKNYRFVVLNDDGTPDETIGTIVNDYLVSESVNIDERMCSGDTLKFGLCEGSSLEFQYFNKPNITGKRVQAFVDVQYRAGIMGRINASGSFTTPVNGSYTFEVKKGSATGLYITYAGGGDMYVDFVLGQTTDTEELEAGDVVTLNNPSSDVLFEVSTDMWDTIPMGFFDVKKCSRQASTGIIKATCYNKLQSDYLDAKANDLIKDIPTDSATGGTTLQTIQDFLLQDYEISYKETKTAILSNIGAYSFNADQDHVIQVPGLSGTRYFAIKTWHLWCDPPRGKREVISMEKYKNKLRYALNAMKAVVNARVTNPEQAWNNFEQSHVYQSGFGCGNDFYDESSSAITNKYIRCVIENPLPSTENVMKVDIDKYQYVYNAHRINFYLPFGLYAVTLTSGSINLVATLWEDTDCNFEEGDCEVGIMNLDDVQDIILYSDTIADVTLRDLVSANYELHNQFGQLSRTTDLFSGVELNHSRLYPADSLYPATDLYPDGAALSGFKSMYSKLWADEGNIHKWRYLIITYKGLNADQQEEDFTLQKTVNADGTDDYNMSDNWLFRNLVWTYEQVEAYALAMVAKMQDMTWFPFEMWCAGLPYLETGDEIEIPLNGESYTSYVLQRQLKGIQNLQDTYINGTLDIF